ncbi:hypothetical protein M9978_03800 [Sphingomonas sp. MG17]|uniref:Uncharacterized protein n=1 Tax=Sphingomonas tagetis TaxID=2949092 RepID=A0A9X2HLM8_9SPHN|nr:hypothetical protein [Sphingomonas tagetis]MCP3729543.1 hypothetical protein [Sphingomonas tagetis]
MRFGKFGLILAALAGVLTGGQAMAQQRCGLTTVSGGVATVQYDPFSPTSFNAIVSNLQLSRINGPNGSKSAVIDFYIKSNNTALNGTHITPLSAVGSGSGSGFNQDIFFGSDETPPALNPPGSGSPPAGLFRWTFTGNNAASDLFTLNVRLELPAQLDLSAGATLPFDIAYSCSGTGNGGPFTETGTYSNAITVNVTVLSGLRASYAGTALNFGDVGDKSTPDVLGAPGTYTTPLTNYIRVESSGPYKVELASPQSYRLTYPGGNFAVANQSLQYKVRFLGQTKTTASPVFTPVICQRAGLAIGSDNLPIAATLLEGGQAKLTSPNYGEVLVVTVTPLLTANAVGPQDCPAIALPAL